MNSPTPVIDWLYLLPVLIVLGSGVVGVLVESFVRDHQLRRSLQVIIAAASAIAALGAVVFLWLYLDGDGVKVDDYLFVADRQSLLWQGMIALFAALSVFVFAARAAGEDAFAPLAAATPGSSDEAIASRRGYFQTEVFPLALFATGGMMLFTMVSDTIALFVVLEVLSLPLYIMTGLARRRRLVSQEAALKYFLMGAFASAVYLFGAALTYGFSAGTSFAEIASAARTSTQLNELLLVGATLMLVGLFFKLGAVPFHAWTPDAYQGAPTAVTGFMAAATKAAAAAALLRLLFGGLYPIQWELTPVLWTVAIMTMVVGTVVALVQTDIKRMLAYSSVAHAGFLLVAVSSFDAQALSAVPFYMFAYGVATVGAFAVVSLVREAGADGALGAEATRLGQWAGLGRRSPMLGTAMAIFLMSFAGIPLTAGFVGKFVAFKAAIAAGGWPLVVVAVVASAAAAFFYVRLDRPDVPHPRARGPRGRRRHRSFARARRRRGDRRRESRSCWESSRPARSPSPPRLRSCSSEPAARQRGA